MVRFFSLFLLFTIASSLHSQDLLKKRVSLVEQNKSIESILKSLETNELGFTYSSDLLDVKKRVSINVQNETIEQVLKKLFFGQNVEFLTMGDQIIIKKKVKPKEEEKMEEAAKVDTLVASAVSAKIASQALNSSGDTTSESNVGKSENPVKVQTATGGGGADNVQQSEQVAIGVVSVTAPAISRQLTSPVYQHKYDLKPQRRQVETREIESFPKPVKAQKARQPDPEPAEGIRFSASAYTAITNIGGDAGILIGGRGLYYLTPELGVGFGGGGFISPRYRDDVLNGNYRITGGYGGLIAEYSFRPMRKLHFNYHVLVAGGGAVYFREDVLTGVQPNQLNSSIFVLEPGVTLELNVLRWFRAGIDVTYRYTSAGSVKYPNSDNTIFTTESLRGFNLGVSLKFGRF